MAVRNKKKKALTSDDVAARSLRVIAGDRPDEKLTKEQRITRAASDFRWFCRYYLKDYFFADPAEFHTEMSHLVDTQLRVCVAAPREHAKSTILFAKVIQQIVCRKRRFLVLLRDSDQTAKQVVDDIRQELESNNRLVEDFGDLVGGRKWTEAEFITKTDVKVLGRGRGAKLRGLRFRQWRPDMIVADDIEDDEAVESKTQRDKLDRWWNRVVSNVLAPDGALFFIGTILHHDALIKRMLNRTEVYVTRIWTAIKADGKSLWPSRWPLERLTAKRLEIGARAFATEFMNDPANEDDQMFAPSWFRRFDDDQVAGKMTTMAAIDPAIGLKRKNDDTGLCVAAEREGNYFVLKMRLAKLKFAQQIELVLATCREYPISKFGVETVAYQDALRQGVEEASRQAGLQVPLKPVEDISSDKLVRIGRLAPLVEQGRLWFPSPKSSYWTPDVEKCIEQFEALGVSANSHDDGPDVVERVMTLLRKTGGMRTKASLA
jgi:predicted phage terminase large subunit-like protein